MEIFKNHLNHFFDPIKFSNWHSLNPLQKKVCSVIVVAMGLLAIFFSYQYLRKMTNKVSQDDPSSRKSIPPSTEPTPSNHLEEIVRPEPQISFEKGIVPLDDDVSIDKFKDKVKDKGVVLLFVYNSSTKHTNPAYKMINDYAKNEKTSPIFSVNHSLHQDGLSNFEYTKFRLDEDIYQIPTFIIFKNGKERYRPTSFEQINLKILMKVMREYAEES